MQNFRYILYNEYLNTCANIFYSLIRTSMTFQYILFRDIDMGVEDKRNLFVSYCDYLLTVNFQNDMAATFNVRLSNISHPDVELNLRRTRTMLLY